MKTIILNLCSISLMSVFILSCSQEPIEGHISDDFSFSVREKSKMDVPSFHLFFQKQEFSFDTKRELFSFLAKKDKSSVVFLADIIIKDLHQKYADKYGENFRKDNTIWRNFEEDLEDEFEIDEVPPSLVCWLCYLYPDNCESDNDQPYDPDYFRLRVFDEANLTGPTYLFDDSKTFGYTIEELCTGTAGIIILGELAGRGYNWDDKISSFNFETEVLHTSAFLTFYSDPNLTGAEYIYYLSEGQADVIDADLSDNFWRIRGLNFAINNQISSVSFNFHHWQ